MRKFLTLLCSASVFFSCSHTNKSPFESSSSAAVVPAIRARQADSVQVLNRIVSEIYRKEASREHFPGIVYGVVLDGKVLFTGGTGTLDPETRKPATPSSLFRIASMTKSFTAMAILKLRDAGKLSLTEPASKYVPELSSFKYPTKDSSPITVLNLLTMTAGLPEDNPWGDRQLEDTDEEFNKFLRQGVSFSNVPGHTFEYSNLSYAILGRIITNVSGKRYQDYITDEILKPLGMHDTHWEFANLPNDKLAIGYRWEDERWKKEPMLHDGAFGAMGGLITSIDDFSRYLLFHLSAWPASDAPDNGPVKRASLREMHRPLAPKLIMNAKKLDGTSCPFVTGYAYGLVYREDCNGLIRISHSGGLPGFGSEYRFYPDYGIGVVSFANRTYAGAGVLNLRVIDTLVLLAKLKPHIVQPSATLIKRSEEVAQLLTSWDEKLGSAILAENFFLDQSRDSWIRQSKDIFSKAGKIKSREPFVAENLLRGYFNLVGEKKKVKVYITLSPEQDPKIQQLDLTLLD